MVVKIICLCICAALLFVCYRTQIFAEKVMKKQEITDQLLLNIKIVALIIACVLFVCTLVFFKS